MPTYTTSHITFLELFSRVESSRPDLVQKAIEEAAEAGVPIIKEAAPEDTGLLGGTTYSEPTSKGAQLVADTFYASAVENGCAPHWPPDERIREWVLRHGTFPTSEALERAVYLVRRKIATVGIAPTWFVLGNLPKLVDILKDSISANLQK